MFRLISLGSPVLSASSAVMEECVMTPVPRQVSEASSFYCAIQGIGETGGGRGSAWRFQSAGRTDIGRVREENQDAFSLQPDLELFIVADGMGGRRGGKVASRMAADGVADYAQILPSASPVERLEILKGAFNLCSAQIFERGSSEPELMGMGTTLVALHLNETAGLYFIAYAGDSRVYRIREKRMEQLTDDHSFRNECKKMGAPAERWSLFPRSIITRAVGIDNNVETDVLTGELREGDIFLLCSDGLTEALFDDAILRIILDHDDLDKACKELIERANEGGGPDNITVVLVRALRST